MTYNEVRADENIRVYIAESDRTLAELGFTEHSFAHVTAVAEKAGYILETMGYPVRTVELAKIAGYLHDIGNLVNRVDHSQSGAVMAFRLLDKMNFPANEIAEITAAIGNHDEGTGDGNGGGCGFGRADSGRQDGCAPQPRARTRPNQIRHS